MAENQFWYQMEYRFSQRQLFQCGHSKNVYLRHELKVNFSQLPEKIIFSRRLTRLQLSRNLWRCDKNWYNCPSANLVITNWIIVLCIERSPHKISGFGWYVHMQKPRFKILSRSLFLWNLRKLVIQVYFYPRFIISMKYPRLRRTHYWKISPCFTNVRPLGLASVLELQIRYFTNLGITSKVFVFRGGCRNKLIQKCQVWEEAMIIFSNCLIFLYFLLLGQGMTQWCDVKMYQNTNFISIHPFQWNVPLFINLTQNLSLVSSCRNH